MKRIENQKRFWEKEFEGLRKSNHDIKKGWVIPDRRGKMVGGKERNPQGRYPGEDLKSDNTHQKMKRGGKWGKATS